MTFINPSSNGPIKELSYTFPLYDGVSVVGFICHVEDRVLQGEVKAKAKADAEYREAVDLGQTAGILDHPSSAPDVFVIRLGNVAADGKVVVKITFIEELKQDAQSDGVRYTLPNVIAPRYGFLTPDTHISSSALPAERHGVSITVDVAVPKGSTIRGIDSPSHPIKILLERTSASPESTFEPHQASASLHLAGDNAFLDRDFVIKVNADGQDKPHALLETHPTIPNQRALMTTLVPKFNLPSNSLEIVFIIDRSGSMTKIPTLRSALKVFLKSLPLGVHSNICSFGNIRQFFSPHSVPYDEQSLKRANELADLLEADMGGTEMHGAVEATVNNRLGDKDLEVLILTDGAIWNQDELFSFVADASSENKIRFFTLGIGDAASHSLIEEIDRKVVRMLKGALMPHIHDYKLEVEYDAPLETETEFELVDPVDEPISVLASPTPSCTEKTTSPEPVPREPISLYDSEYKEPSISIEPVREIDLPSIPLPDVLQTPSKIPNLYPFIRLSAYILLDPRTSGRIPQSLVFRATSKHGPLVLRIPIQDIGKGEIIHQLACRKAVRELEEGHGWLEEQTKNVGQSKKNGLMARECERLGTQFQVTGKHCSFVAVEKNESAKFQSVKVQKPGIVAGDLVKGNYLQSPNQRHCDRGSRGGGRVGALPRARFCMARTVLNSPVSNTGPRSFGSPGSPRALFRSAIDQQAVPLSSTGPSNDNSPSASPPERARGACFVDNRDESSYSGFPGASTKNPFMAHQAGNAIYSLSSANMKSLGDFLDEDLTIAPNKVHAIIELQSFHGFWKWSTQLLNILELDEAHVKEKIMKELRGIAPAEDPFGNDNNATILATMLVIAFLENNFAESKDTWELVQAKAENWIQSHDQTGTHGSVFNK
ncbi:Von Willebrand [Aspergillus sclerotialis]|uniref:von Willebrand n=1 Tax=Aspergillus sclerotialis TaxID=2070753 RepID=A0A3A2ZEI3_9EURO|nr:Von Willebrand [Aspergillus sclerotialis]